MLIKILHFITSLPINCSVTVVKLLHNYVIEDPFLYIGQLLNCSNFTIFCEKNWRIGCIQVFKTKVIILFSLFMTSMLIKYCIIVSYNFFLEMEVDVKENVVVAPSTSTAQSGQMESAPNLLSDMVTV